MNRLAEEAAYFAAVEYGRESEREGKEELSQKVAALERELALTRKALDGAVQTERARCLSIVERELGRSHGNAETALDHVYAAIENG